MLFVLALTQCLDLVTTRRITRSRAKADQGNIPKTDSSEEADDDEDTMIASGSGKRLALSWSNGP